MRLIDADALIEKCGGWYVEEGTESGFIGTLKNLLAIQPTVQPEIIHCKDCKHHFTHRCMDSIPTEICDLNQTFYDAEVDFCSLAER